VRRRLAGFAAGTGAALLPLIAGAQSATGGRATDAPADFDEALALTLLGLVGVFVLATLGYLYRVKRGLSWRFQEPDAPHDEHH
jgi:hypothetical protein